MGESKIKIAIAGGGIAGLALAAGLSRKKSLQQHLEVHVYEAVPAYGDVGAGLALHLNAIRALGLIDPELREAYFRKALHMAEDEGRAMATEVILAQGPHSGQRVAELGRAKGRRTVSRADLLDGFLELVPGDCISFGKRLVGVEERRPPSVAVAGEDDGEAEADPPPPLLELTFQDGTRAAADCLLGADGVHSFVRRHLLGAEHPAAAPRNRDGWQIYRVTVPAEEARRRINPRWTQHVPILLGPRGHVNCIPLSKGTRLSAGVAVRRGGSATTTTAATTALTSPPKDADHDNGNGDEKESSGGSRAPPPPLDPALYADYSPDAQQIIRLVAARGGASVSWTPTDHDHAPCYARRGVGGSPVAILGDAAHAALPFAGNGAAQALEDAAVLDCLLGAVAAELQQQEQQEGQRRRGRGRGRRRRAIEDALLAYDYVRRPRSQAVVDLARKFGRIYAYAEDGLHEDPPRLRAFFAEAAAFTNDFDVRGQNEAALERFRMLRETAGDGADGSA